ncbi:MAG TPA: hypothetical protein VKI61_17295 [Chitinophagaceae bacterium]|nr:hypothetical protein [Chitinophagaceae bacterium]
MKILLWILSGFIALTAIVSGFIILTHPDSQVMQLDTSILKNKPIDNFLVPALY